MPNPQLPVLVRPRPGAACVPPVLIALLLAGTGGARAQAGTPDFSLTPDSPEVTAGVVDPADDRNGAGLAAGNQASRVELNLLLGDDIDAMSDGMDQVPLGSIYPCWGVIWQGIEAWHYSVSRDTQGVEDAVFDEVGGNGACGDKFVVGQCLPGPVLFLFLDPAVEGDAPAAGLTPGASPPQASDIDALDSTYFNAVRAVNRQGLYFSLAPDSPTLTAGNFSPADILFQRRPGDTPWPVGLFATEGELGLQPGDDIDALALVDLPPLWDFNPPADVVYVSLKPGSPTLDDLGASAADVLQLGFPGFAPAPFVVVPAQEFDLQFDDDMDALTVTDPGHGHPITDFIGGLSSS